MDSRIQTIQSFIKQELLNFEGGHDYWHAMRVFSTATKLANTEGGNLFIIQAAALLHDIADSKFSDSNEKPLQNMRDVLASCAVSTQDIETICSIITHVSFQGGFPDTEYSSIELEIVQDADRLDAMGAIGIARAFNYGGFRGRELYNPNVPPQKFSSAEEYRKSQSHTVNHFYEKLFLLRDLMNTQTAKKIAQQRHAFMEQFVRQFLDEWNIIV